MGSANGRYKHGNCCKGVSDAKRKAHNAERQRKLRVKWARLN